eukprot:TRINITY_DN18423_c0_g1_i1.p4 TRINITY_DN18423_c0_g1~~TRINITY_DN18423_c0_g1_i1.p4  ORF type:complete len:114 (-),score=33.17 TRINITY_DN18423_c0_g1_i1:28-369(-)
MVRCPQANPPLPYAAMAPSADTPAAGAPTTSPFPAAPLRTIAAAAGVAVDDLAVLEVGSSQPLFDAATDYAARYPRRGGAGGAKAPQLALWYNPRNGCEWGPTADSEDDNETA